MFFYDKNDIKIINGDCFSIMPLLKDINFDLVLTDPPYGLTSCEWDVKLDLNKLWNDLKLLSKDSTTYIFCSMQPFTSHLILSNLKWFKYEWIWGKSKCGSSLTAKYRPLAKHENILVFNKGKTKYNPEMLMGEPYKRNYTPNKINNHKFGIKGVKIDNKGTRFPDTILFFQQNWRRQDQYHPTQKPIELMEYLIKTYTDENDIIFDPFMGSGTTLIAAKQLNRKAIGVEISKDYCEIAVNRLENCYRKVDII